VDCGAASESAGRPVSGAVNHRSIGSVRYRAPVFTAGQFSCHLQSLRASRFQQFTSIQVWLATCSNLSGPGPSANTRCMLLR